MTTTNTERPPKLKVRIIGRNRTPLRKTPAPMASTLARRCRQPMRPLPSMDGPATMTARRAADALTRALLTMAARGERTRPHQLWLSEHEAERAEAVKLCRGCPVIQPCHQAAEEREERWGAWGGVDRSIRPGRKDAA